MISASLSLDESIECIYNLYEAKVATFIIQNHNKKRKRSSCSKTLTTRNIVFKETIRCDFT